jgi:hypothetical protein
MLSKRSQGKEESVHVCTRYVPCSLPLGTHCVLSDGSPRRCVPPEGLFDRSEDIFFNSNSDIENDFSVHRLIGRRIGTLPCGGPVKDAAPRDSGSGGSAR